MTTGRLIVLEGVNGVGKTSLAKGLVARLSNLGNECRYASFPGQDPGTIGALVYRVHHHPKEVGVSSISPTALQMLHLAAHLDAIETKIEPRLSSGEWVVLDRYWWSTWVYGIVDGANRKVLESVSRLERRLWAQIEPSPLFLIQRKIGRRSSERVERLELLEREYAALVREHSGPFPVRVVNNDRSLEATLDEMEKSVISHRVPGSTATERGWEEP